MNEKKRNCVSLDDLLEELFPSLFSPLLLGLCLLRL